MERAKRSTRQPVKDDATPPKRRKQKSDDDTGLEPKTLKQGQQGKSETSSKNSASDMTKSNEETKQKLKRGRQVKIEDKSESSGQETTKSNEETNEKLKGRRQVKTEIKSENSAADATKSNEETNKTLKRGQQVKTEIKSENSAADATKSNEETNKTLKRGRQVKTEIKSENSAADTTKSNEETNETLKRGRQVKIEIKSENSAADATKSNEETNKTLKRGRQVKIEIKSENSAADATKSNEETNKTLKRGRQVKTEIKSENSAADATKSNEETNKTLKRGRQVKTEIKSENSAADATKSNEETNKTLKRGRQVKIEIKLENFAADATKSNEETNKTLKRGQQVNTKSQKCAPDTTKSNEETNKTLKRGRQVNTKSQKCAPDATKSNELTNKKLKNVRTTKSEKNNLAGNKKRSDESKRPGGSKTTTKAKKSDPTVETEGKLEESADKSRGTSKYIGAHTSIAGGLYKSVLEAVAMEASAFGLFLKSQRSWTSKPLEDKDAERFQNTFQTHGFSPNMILPHGSYLMNCGSPNPEVLQKSRDNLVDELQRCEKMGLALFNFHPGSSCGTISTDQCICNIAESINQAHAKTKSVTTVIENMCCQGNTIGGKFQELRAIIDQVKDKSRIGVCLDTCHAFAAGYDLSTETGFEEMVKEFEEVIGFKYLKAMHLNDSIGKIGCHLDRHENIGKGEIGIAGFQRIMKHPKFDNIPMILETPVMQEDTYRKEINKLYAMCKS